MSSINSRPIADVVAAARTLTGKVEYTEKDCELVDWLQEQEVTSEADLLALSEFSFQAIQRAPGATLILFDALRKIRDEHLLPVVPKPKATQKQQCSSSSDKGTKARLVEIYVQGPVGTITLSNDSKRNALSHKMCAQISEALNQCCAASVRVIILRAHPGAKVWSAGHDVRDFKRIDGSSALSGQAVFQDPVSRNDALVSLLSNIQEVNVPVIGCIEGSVWGAGTDICACCDVLVGTPSVTFSVTPAKFGLPYNASGMEQFTQVLPLHVVKWMFFSAMPLSSDEALRYGFLNAIVAPEQLTQKAEEMAGIIASRAPLVVTLLKKQLRGLAKAASLSPDAFEELHEMRKKAWMSDDMEEGVQAFFEKRDPKFQGI